MANRSPASAFATDTPSDAFLPQPLHLFAFLSPADHYHVGRFETPEVSLAVAQSCLTRELAEFLEDGASVLDVGCGLGGSARILAEARHRVLGIDPCRPAIQHARRKHGRLARFEVACLDDDRVRAAYSRFDHLLIIEVQPHFPSVESLLTQARGWLGRNGRVILSDFATIPALSRRRVPYPRLKQLAESARRHGFVAVEHRCVTGLVFPTFERILEELQRWEGELRESFAGTGRPLEDELGELVAQCQLLARAIENGDLAYEITVLEVR